MATIKQKEAVREIVVEKVGSIGEAMRNANYSPNTALTPQKLTESNGYKEEMAKYGLTEELISSSLVADIKAKPQKRVEELKLGSDILRMKVKEGENPVKPELHIHFHKHDEIKGKYEKELEEVLKNDK